MGKVILDISTSPDGVVAGPNPTLEEPLGAGGDLLHCNFAALVDIKREHARPGE